MKNISFDNLQYPSNYIMFTDIPNIVRVEDIERGTYATIELTVMGSMKAYTDMNNQWQLTIMGETISNVLQPKSAINKYFCVMNSTYDTATSIARALRNCPTVAANFVIQSSQNKVTIKAKVDGEMFEDGISQNIQTNIPANYLQISSTDGTSYSALYNAKVGIDIYNNQTYVTTLEKNAYGGLCEFNISPVLTTFAEAGKAKPFHLQVYMYKDGVQTYIGYIATNFITVGYMVNQGNKYIDNSYISIAQNISRGKDRSVTNNSILYVYNHSIPISVFTANESQITVTKQYLDSAYNLIAEEMNPMRIVQGEQLQNFDLTLNDEYMGDAFYVDLRIDNMTIRYNVIKPILMTEHCQRICFRNSYGGVSFFDFTGQKTEGRTLETQTYEKNIFNYYTDQRNELEKIYDNDVNYTVTLKSHLIENDGKYIFNDMLQSPEVWTEVNGEKYAIIIESISVDETNNNDIYEATIRYHYSQKPSLI